MMDDSKLQSWLWPTSGRPSAPPAPRTTDERLLVLEITSEQHTGQIGQLHQEFSRIREAQIDAARAKATRDEIKAEDRAARQRAMAVIALMISVGTLCTALTKLVLDTRPPPSHAAGVVSGSR